MTAKTRENQCWGLTSLVFRCQRRGDWNLFCYAHRRQPLAWAVTVLMIAAAVATLHSWTKSTDAAVADELRELRELFVSTISEPRAGGDLEFELRQLADRRQVSVEELLETLSSGNDYDLGLRAFAEKDYDAAIRHADNAASSSIEEAADALFLMGESSERLKDVPGALDAYRRALLVNPIHEGALFATGFLLGKEGDFRAAIPYLKRFVRQQPESQIGNYALGLALYQDSKYKAAIVPLTIALSVVRRVRVSGGAVVIDGQEAAAGQWYPMKQRFDGTLSMLPEGASLKSTSQKVRITMDPPLHTSWSPRRALERKADSLNRTGDHQAALTDFTVLQASGYETAGVLYGLAWAQCELRLHTDCRENLNKLVVIEPKLPEVWEHLVSVTAELDDVEGFTVACGRLSELAPSSPMSVECIGIVKANRF